MYRVQVCTRLYVRTTLPMRRSEGDLQELVPSIPGMSIGIGLRSSGRQQVAPPKELSCQSGLEFQSHSLLFSVQGQLWTARDWPQQQKRSW